MNGEPESRIEVDLEDTGAALRRAEAEVERWKADWEALRNDTGTRTRAAEAEVERLREALERIRTDEGKVCETYELCDHRACRSSYTAWAIADAALNSEIR